MRTLISSLKKESANLVAAKITERFNLGGDSIFVGADGNDSFSVRVENEGMVSDQTWLQLVSYAQGIVDGFLIHKTVMGLIVDRAFDRAKVDILSVKN